MKKYFKKIYYFLFEHKYLSWPLLYLFYFFLQWLMLRRIMDIPFRHDEAYAYVPALFNFVDHGLEYVWENPNSFYNHPPFMYLAFYPLVKLGGYSQVYIHYAMLMWVATGYAFSHRIFSYFLKNNYLSMFLVFMIMLPPFWTIEAHSYFGDTFLFPLFCIFIYFFLYFNQWGLFFTGLICGLTRESSLALFPVFFLIDFLKHKKLKNIWVYSGPFIGLCIFYLFEYLKDGVFFDHAAFEQGVVQLKVTAPLEHFKNTMTKTLLQGGKIYLTVFGLVGWGIWLVWKKLIKNESIVNNNQKLNLLSLFLLFLTFLGFFSFNSVVIPRYMNPLNSVFILLVFFPWINLNKYLAILAGYLVMNASIYYASYSYGIHYKVLYAYVDSVSVEMPYMIKKTFIDLDKLPNDYPVVTLPWPTSGLFWDKRLGYTKSKRKQLTFISREEEPKENYYFIWTDFYNNKQGFEYKEYTYIKERYDLEEVSKKCSIFHRNTCIYIYKLTKKGYN